MPRVQEGYAAGVNSVYIVNCVDIQFVSCIIGRVAHLLTKYCYRTAIFLIVVCLPAVWVHPLHAGSSETDRPQVVSRQEIVEAMRQRGDYDPTATTNGARFQAEVALYLVRQARERDPEGPPLFLGHEAWFQAFLEVTGRTVETAPMYALLAYRHEQDMEIDYRTDRVIREVKKGDRPKLAVNVVIWWPKKAGGTARYSYQDTLSTPRLKVTNRRVMTYRLLDFGDRVVYDGIKGLTGRPTSGILGFLFRIIGEGRVVQSRMAISEDGLQVSRARAKKAFMGVTATVTVSPDGRTEKDVPEDRPDLMALEERLKRPLEIDYVPLGAFKER